MKEVWITWTCPKCGEKTIDPSTVITTQCVNGHSVVLDKEYNEDFDKIAVLKE